ncbi:unnamed protein product [Nezara viridula]|uniref:SAYSvFN domain-containing protein n=1 Tax=Nezara viridula TaxID=85310 RepID=A0A9P0ECS2_NEZVI|nr:unnamed protein product [Nezara viridula]
MDEKLESFRRNKSRQLFKTKVKDMTSSFLLTAVNFFSRKHKFSNNESIEELEKDSVDVDSSLKSETLNIVTLKTFLLFILWTGKRPRDEISAYSVFNRNCERIDGTFSAEEFEKQLRKGML